MPLTELARYLSAAHPARTPGPRHSPSHAPFLDQAGKVSAHFADLELSSLFLPVFDTATGRVRGHAASLQAVSRKHGTALGAHAVFVLPCDDVEFVYLDRLVRTLHALSYLKQPERGDLLLRVHPRHVQSVPANHGATFAQLLRHCGLTPGQITLEIDIDGGTGFAHLEQAAANYKACGFHLAIHRFGRIGEDYRLLARLAPDIVRLDASLLESPQRLATAVREIHALNARILIADSAARSLSQGARAAGIDLLQADAPLPRITAHAGIGRQGNSGPLRQGQPGLSVLS